MSFKLEELKAVFEEELERMSKLEKGKAHLFTLLTLL